MTLLCFIRWVLFWKLFVLHVTCMLEERIFIKLIQSQILKSTEINYVAVQQNEELLLKTIALIRFFFFGFVDVICFQWESAWKWLYSSLNFLENQKEKWWHTTRCWQHNHITYSITLPNASFLLNFTLHCHWFNFLLNSRTDVCVCVYTYSFTFDISILF